MNNLAHDLFLLMASLAQVKHRDRLLAVFTEAINSMQPDFAIAYQAESPAPEAASMVRLRSPTMAAERSRSIDICTAHRQFGYFRVTGAPQAVSPEFPGLFQNSVQMLAVFLEKLHERALLADEQLRLQEQVAVTTARLRKNEDLLNATQQMSKIGGWEWDLAQQTMFWTQEMYRLHGLALDDMPPGSSEHIAQSLACYDAADRPIIAEAFRQCAEEGLPYDLEFPFTPLHGQRIRIRTTAIAVKQHGKISKVRGNLMDITERKRAEEELLREQLLMTTLLDSLPGVFYLYSYPALRLVRWNKNHETLLGFGPGEIKDRSILEWHIPEAHELVLQAVEVVMAKGQNMIEATLLTKDGRSIPFLMTGVKLAVSGQTYLMGVGIDITDRKRAEEALRASEQKLSTLFEAMTEMVALHEVVRNDRGEAVNYRITDCNQAFTRITGIRKADAVGKLASEVYQAEPAPYLAEFGRVGLTGEPYEFTTYYAPLDKHFLISVVSPQQGQFATITTDITAMKQMQDVVSAKNKELENYLYVASHDLRSPLVNIQGFSQRLQKQANAIKKALAGCRLAKETEQQLEKIMGADIPRTLEFIFTNVAKMDTLIKGLLQISRTGRVKMTIRQINMNALLANVMRALNFQIETAAGRLVVDDLPDCYGDENLLNQLFSNVIGNALKYREPTRPLVVTITAQTRPQTIEYSIRDTGIGIAPRHSEKIWDVFYQVDAQAPEAGEGIGLSLAKRITDKHKGKIGVASEEGRGSVFYLELPNHEFSE